MSKRGSQSWVNLTTNTCAVYLVPFLVQPQDHSGQEPITREIGKGVLLCSPSGFRGSWNFGMTGTEVGRL